MSTDGADIVPFSHGYAFFIRPDTMNTIFRIKRVTIITTAEEKRIKNKIKEKNFS